MNEPHVIEISFAVRSEAERHFYRIEALLDEMGQHGTLSLTSHPGDDDRFTHPFGQAPMTDGEWVEHLKEIARTHADPYRHRRGEAQRFLRMLRETEERAFLAGLRAGRDDASAASRWL